MGEVVHSTTFLPMSCDSALQDIVGRYVGSDGKSALLHRPHSCSFTDTLTLASTWTQPPIVTDAPPYNPRIPASSNCLTYTSVQLFASTASSATTTTSIPSPGSNSGSPLPTGSDFGAATSPVPTKTSGTVCVAHAKVMMAVIVFTLFIAAI
jgi:hypothetical protein